jgi:hypothetical protein
VCWEDKAVKEILATLDRVYDQLTPRFMGELALGDLMQLKFTAVMLKVRLQNEIERRKGEGR